ncbi:MAG: mRNA surveillance protein pelota [Candidatus Thermoplasmatota archaeon]|nr:mRNA surveillance protein pelota [Candidatus Thermoplasmatota archaeon]
MDRKNRIIKGIVERDDDLWVLYKMVVSKDRVSGYTYRKESNSVDKIRPEKMSKVRIYLTIEVEELLFHEFTGVLRIKGIIVEGQDVGKYHTFSVSIGDEIKIEKKDWNSSYDKLLSDSSKPSAGDKILFIVMEGNEAYIALMNGYNINEIATITANFGGKYYDESEGEKRSFYKEVLEVIKREIQDKRVVIIGPGFYKEGFFNWLKETDKSVADGIHLYKCSMGGINGIYEIMKSGILDTLLKDIHIYQENVYMERLLYEIASGNKYSYGREEVKRAIDNNAVETLLVLDELIHDDTITKFIDESTKHGSGLFIFKATNDNGKKLKSLGGIAALLRFPIAT